MLFVSIGVINRQTFFHQLVGSMCSINFLGGLLQFDVDIVVKIFRKDTGMKKIANQTKDVLQLPHITHVGNNLKCFSLECRDC